MLMRLSDFFIVSLPREDERMINRGNREDDQTSVTVDSGRIEGKYVCYYDGQRPSRCKKYGNHEVQY